MEFQYSIHPPLLDSPTSNSITYEYSTSETDYASTTDADAAKRYGTERRRKIKLKESML